MEKLEIKAGATFQHFKGNKYVVVGKAVDAVTKEAVVVYKCDITHDWYDKYGDMLFTRTATSWFEEVSEHDDNTTGQTQRFIEVEKINQDKDFWIFENGNKYSKTFCTYSAAIELNSTLVNCKDCVNCERCTDCEGCVECRECTNCSDCIGSASLIDSYGVCN